ncbi:hypothetical protein FEF26_07920 [Nesterenkonia salmonea]|uniref:Uncharacterized protein n=1 Tax=Nesterenkonia salmonea TaxID=1804987 RepID=A0A5R9BCN6_9MICC|nr:hypothetical protein [Nesterenkonia salmonea]TLP97372.1 hypothetical protein FEF26_07920 [Nesterenkonia salmonea]
MEPELQTVLVTIGASQGRKMRYAWAEFNLLPAERVFLDWLIREVEAARLPDGAVLEYILNEDQSDEIHIPEDLPPGPGARLPGARMPVLLRIGIGGGALTYLALRLSELELGMIESAAQGFEASLRKRGGPFLDYKLGPDFGGCWQPGF